MSSPAQFIAVSPSYKRPHLIRTHKWLPNLTYVVMESEAKEYRELGVKVMTCPDKIQGNISRVRNWILDQYYLMSDQILIVDDDIDHLRAWDKDVDDSWIARDLRGDQAVMFIEQGFSMAREWGARLWGVNCMPDKGSYREYTPFSMKTFCSAAFHGHIENPLRYDIRIPLKEDYDYCIQHCNQYRRLLRFNMAHLIKKDHGNVGGCAVIRSVEREREQFDILQKKWGPSIVCTDAGKSQVRRKKNVDFDINPVMRIPINGV